MTSDKCHLYILLVGFRLKVTIWNIIFETLLNPPSGRLSSNFYSCAMVSCKRVVAKCRQLSESDSSWGSSQRGDRFALAHPHSVTGALGTKSMQHKGQKAGQSPGPSRWQRQLTGPHGNWLHPRNALVWKELSRLTGETLISHETEALTRVIPKFHEWLSKN